MILAAAVVMLACAANPAPCGGAEHTTPARAVQDDRVRALDPRVRAWMETGAAQSRTFNELLGRLTKSDLIVYVEIVDRIASGADGQTLFVTSATGTRYVRIQLIGNGRPVEMIALLAHELQHAVEIADAPHVRDSATMAALYLRPDRPTGPYDSAAAREIGDRVKDEMAFYTPPHRRSAAADR